MEKLRTGDFKYIQSAITTSPILVSHFVLLLAKEESYGKRHCVSEGLVLPSSVRIVAVFHCVWAIQLITGVIYVKNGT